jgi:hypothetical protein
MRLAPCLSGIALALFSFACGGRGGTPPGRPPIFVGQDGQKYYLMEKGPYTAFYDPWGRLSRLEYDANEDGKADHVAHHEGKKLARLLEIDSDFDGLFERWEYFDDQGLLVKVGAARKSSAPDIWTFADETGQVVRIEYDEDGDGAPDRGETLVAGVVRGVDLDTDRDGKPDRWQKWEAGRLLLEELDTDADGVADRRLRYGAQGEVLGMESLDP